MKNREPNVMAARRAKAASIRAARSERDDLMAYAASCHHASDRALLMRCIRSSYITRLTVIDSTWGPL